MLCAHSSGSSPLRLVIQLSLILVEVFLSFPAQIPVCKFLQSSPPLTHKSDADCIPSHTPSQVSLSEAHFRYVTSQSPVFSWIWGSEQNGSFLSFCLNLLFWFSVHFLLFASSGLCFRCAKNCSLRSTFYLQWRQTRHSGNPIFNYLLEAFPVSSNPSPPPTHITRCALPCPLTQGIARLPNPFSWGPEYHSSLDTPSSTLIFFALFACVIYCQFFFIFIFLTGCRFMSYS